MKENLTTTDVAKLLGLHVNTLKNWVRDGKLPSFRTIGGHYRIRVEELVVALRDRGIPIPEELAKSIHKKVYVVHPEEEVRAAIERGLTAQGALNVSCFGTGVDALLAMGGCMPSVVIWNAGQTDVDAVEMVRSLRRKEAPRKVEFLLINSGESGNAAELPGELSGIPAFSYPENLAQIVKWVRVAVES